MCGIAAIVGSDAPPGAIERMTACLRHRGPDDTGLKSFAGCELGHRRLRVIDLATGDQPMADATERCWIIFNGEIFNYRELRAELEARGHAFRTSSDTEVLLATYREYGDEAPRHLLGQFAFLIWDVERRRLFGARDRFGEKPLYWAQAPDGQLLLASEVKGLLASDMVGPLIDRGAVDAYLAMLYVPPHRTIYENVGVIRPGHALSVENGRLRQWAYWEPRYSVGPAIEPGDAIAEVRRLVEQAVRRQMVADVPVGAFLSGGLDSSTIVALMSAATSHRVQTFSVGFGDLIDELPHARAVARQYDTEHAEIQMDIPVGEMLERMAEVYDEPFADSSNIPTYLISEFARRHVTVVLSGDGGDELFGGYDWYRPLLDTSAPLGAAEAALARVALAGARVLSRVGVATDGTEPLAQAYARSESLRRFPDPWDRHVTRTTALGLERRSWWNGSASANSLAEIAEEYRPDPSVSGLDRATDFDVRVYLPGDILVKVDRAAMAHGLETRAPLLDPDLSEFVLGLPASLRFRDGNLKYLLREACADLWPAELRGRGKMGFGAPVRQWLDRPDVSGLEARVHAPSSALTALLSGVRGLRESLTAQQRWTLICLGLWLERRPGCLTRQS